MLLGLVLMLAVAVATGLTNGSLIRFAHFTPIAATLTLYIALGGLALLLRPEQGGFIAQSFQDFVNRAVGPIPVAFVAAGRPDDRHGAAAAPDPVGLAAAGGRLGRGRPRAASASRSAGP